MKRTNLLVNLDRCTGCWTCALACMVGNGLPDGEFWMTVRTLGSGEGIDRPAGSWPNLRMSWMPVWSESCIGCAGRVGAGEPPYCANACPNGALSYGGAADEAAETLKEAGFRLFSLSSWEQSREGVTYARKG